jgi:hypothetical protein
VLEIAATEFGKVIGIWRKLPLMATGYKQVGRSFKKPM